MELYKHNKLLLFQEIFIGIYIFVSLIIGFNFYSVFMIAGLAVLAVAFVAIDLFHNANLFRTYKIDLIILFLGINILSMAINFRYGLSDNIFLLFTLFVDFFVLYNVGGGRTESQVHQFFCVVSHVFIYIVTSMSLFSLLGYCLRQQHVFYIDGRMVRHGFVDNRLFGIFPDPNYAAINCLVIAMICIYYAKKSSDKMISGLYYSATAISICYMVLSGSRTAILSALAAVLVGVYFYTYRKFRHLNGAIKRQARCIFIAIVMMVAALLSFEALRFGLSYLPTTVDYLRGKEITTVTPIALAREDVENSKDYTNNRVKIWKSSFEIFKEKPLFGTSPRNFHSYAQKEFPASYIATSEYMVHNSLYEVLVFTGLLGFMVLCIFIGCCVYRTFRCLLLHPDDHFSEILLGTMIIVVLLTSSMTLSALFYNRGDYNTLFWLTLGYLTYFTCPKKESKTLIVVNKLLRRKPSSDETTIKGDTNGR